jgi:hypothetical protein
MGGNDGEAEALSVDAGTTASSPVASPQAPVRTTETLSAVEVGLVEAPLLDRFALTSRGEDGITADPRFVARSRCAVKANICDADFAFDISVPQKMNAYQAHALGIHTAINRKKHSNDMNTAVRKTLKRRWFVERIVCSLLVLARERSSCRRRNVE